MATQSFGTIKHRSFAYFLLLVATGLVGIAGTVLLKLALEPLAAEVEGTGFWPDFIRGSLTSISLVPGVVAVVAGRRLIRRLWTVLPDDDPAN